MTEEAKILAEIYRILITPSGTRKACEHFASDFHLIRKLTEPYRKASS